MNSYGIIRCDSCQQPFARERYSKMLPNEASICTSCKDKARFNPEITTPMILFTKKPITPSKNARTT